jgi:mannosyltransferase
MSRFGQRQHSKPGIGLPSWARFNTAALARSAGIWHLTLVILLVAFVLRVYRLDAQSIWWDEGHSIQMASAALAQIPTLPGMDVHPPGYFVLLHQWMSIAGQSEFALRYLSLAFSLLTVALLMRFGWALAAHAGGFLNRTSLVVGGLAALSPLYVAYAQEVRMYAVVTFFALASVYFQWQFVTGPPPPERGRVGEGVSRLIHPGPPSLTGKENSLTWPVAGYVLATAASLYIHYFTLFLLLFENLTWLIWALIPRATGGARRGRVTLWLSTQLATLVLFLPQLPLALRQTTAYANPNLNPPGIREFVSRSWLAYTLGTAVDPVTGRWLAAILAAILSLVVLSQFVWAQRGVHGGRLGTAAFFAGWFLIPLAAYFLVLQRQPSFEPRYMMLVTPALMLLLAQGLAVDPPWGSSAERHRIGWGGVEVLLVMAAFAWGTWSYFTRVESYKDDSAGVAAWLATETTPNDVVYVDVPHPFHYYADRIPAPTHYLFVDVHTVADVLNAEAAGRDRLFWVTWWGSDTDPRGVIPFLLDKIGRRGGEIDFRGYHVTWWDLPRDAYFSLPGDLSSVDITFGDTVRLDGLAFSDAVQVGGGAWATLHFALLRDTGVDYRVSLRLVSPEGNMLPPTDKDLLDDRHFRTSAWPLDDPRLNQAINVYTLPIPPDVSPGSYRLEAVVYDATTLEALPVAGGSVSSGISAFLGTVVVSPRNSPESGSFETTGQMWYIVHTPDALRLAGAY